MELPSRAGGYRQSRRSRSQRDRERKMAGTGGRDSRPYSPSSGSDREAGEGPGSSRPRPPRRRRRESTSCEEDIIDGFAITSFPTLEALEKDTMPKPPERVDNQRKRLEKRKPEENRQSSPCEGLRRAESPEREQNRHNGERDHRNQPPTKKVKTKGLTRGNESTGGENGSSQRSSSRGVGSDVSAHSSLGTGYFCDIDSDPDDKPLGDDAFCSRRLNLTSAQEHVLQSMWQRISFATTDDGLSNFFTAATKIASDLNGAVTPKGETKVSGLERSQERNQGSDKDPLLVPSLPTEPVPQAAAANSAQTPARSQAQAGTTASAPTGSRTPVPPLSNHHHQQHHPHRQSTPARVTPQPKPQTPVQPQHQTQPKVQPFSQHHLVYLSSRSSTPSKPLAPASQLLHRASTPSSLTLGLSNQSAAHGFAPALRPSSQPHHPHPGMFTPSPGLPPPPPLTSTMLQVAGHPSTAAVAAAAFSEQELIRQELNSRYLSSQGTERAAALGPPSFQFHQHSHQHQHTHQHTHQHFAPYPTIPQPGLVPAPAPSMVRTPRRNYFQGYHAPVSGIPSVLPPAGPFSSLQGAFQPKTPNPELSSRSGQVPHTLLQKDPRLTEAYRPTIRKPGKWCAMHVQIAWMIYQHQEKNKMIHPDHHKMDFTKTDLLSRNASSLFGPIAHSHELARPASLFTAADAVHAASSPFAPPNALNSFLNPSSHLDPYGRAPAYSAIGQLTNRAFGGLGNPAVAVSTVFAHKENTAVQGIGASRDHWNRLHQTPPSFPTPPPAWPRSGEGERERAGLLDKEADSDKHEIPFIKEEKEREAVYSRHTIRMSPANQKNGSLAPAMDEERGRPRSSSEPRGAARERAEPPRDHFKQEHRGREFQLPVAEDSRHAAKRPGEESGKGTSVMGREPSPYSRRPASSEGPKPSLLRELAKRHEVKVKEERKEEHDLMAGGVAPPGFESTAQLQRSHVPGGAAHTLHALHSLPVPLAVVGQVNGLGVLERNRVLAGPFLGVGHHGMAPSAGGERLPHYGWDPFRDSWREACRGPEVSPLHQRYPVAQHQPQHRFYEPERAYRERQLLREFVPEGLLAETRREQEAVGLLEEQLLLREEYDQRARLLSFLGPPHPPHHPYPRVSPSLVHQSGLLSKTPPMATLGAPPPLISSTGVRPGSPATRATPLSANELRDLSTYSHKDRDSR